MILHLDIWQFNLMLRKLRLKTNEVDRLLGITGYLDMAISVGGFRRSLEGYCIPQLEENANKVYLHMEGGWHPLLILANVWHKHRRPYRSERSVTPPHEAAQIQQIVVVNAPVCNCL